MILNKKTEQIFLWSILLLATILRVYKYTELSYFHDELSALSRTQFDSIYELFVKGIIIDGHPPLIQVFLYFWTGLFGYSEEIVKLPFLIIGISSLYLLFKLSKILSGSSIIALGLTLFFATNQLHISYSTIARMYITSLFFSVGLVYFWWKWINSNEQKDYLWMIVFAVLGFYNHHFNLMFGAIVLVCGIMFITPNQHKSYFKSLGIIAILYLPCLYITYFQLTESKGLSWMSTPDLSFIYDFIRYIFHFKTALAFIVLIGLLPALILKIQNKKILVLSFTWFVVCFGIALCYSIYIAPVIQYHLLLLILPFLILPAFTGWQKLLQQKAIYFFVCIAIVNLYSLIQEREHYNYFDKSSYKTLSEEVLKLNANKVLVVSQKPFKYLDFYLQGRYQYIDTVSVTNLGKISNAELQKKYDYIVTDHISEAIESYFMPYFGSIQPSLQGFDYEIDVLKRQQKNQSSKKEITSQYFNKDQVFWRCNKNNIRIENADTFYLKAITDEWGPDYERELNDDLKTGILTFDLAYIGDETIGEQFWVIDFLDKNNNILSNNIFPFEIKKISDGKNIITASYDLKKLPKEAVFMKAFHWKRSKTKQKIYNISCSITEEIQPVSFVTDSIVAKRDFSKNIQEPWNDINPNNIVINNKGEQCLAYNNAHDWFLSYDLLYDYNATYSFEFEFKSENLNPSSIVIVNAKYKDSTVYYMEKKLASFPKSDSSSWAKASIAIPYTTVKRFKNEPLRVNFGGYKPKETIIKIKNPLIRAYKPNYVLYGSIQEIEK